MATIVRAFQLRTNKVSFQAISLNSIQRYGTFKLPHIQNEPFLHYPPGSTERAVLKKATDQLRKQPPVEIPVIINGKQIFTGDVDKHVMPTDHQHVLSIFHRANPKLVQEAITGALAAKKHWQALPFEDRVSIFLKAADLLSTKYRPILNAAVMLGMGKNIWQAEIDAAVETIDFWRFNAKYAQELYANQPPENSQGVWNRMEYRPLDGFVAAITPFNFIAIGSNLCCSPAQMGNVVLWKPAETTMLASYIVYQILAEAGLPEGVIQFLPGLGPVIGTAMLSSSELAGVHFTGSTATFKHLWKQVGQNLDIYKCYPRVVGETGGKNFHFVHKSCGNQIDNIVYHTIRGAFEYNGQKCSATSRMYIPDNLWPAIKEKLLSELKTVKVGQPDEVDTFVTAVINEASFDKITRYLDAAKKDPSVEIIAGGNGDKSKGYFIEPTVIVTSKPDYVTMKEELFGPVLTIYVYPADKYEETLDLCDQTSPYALTGSLFCSDRLALEFGARKLRECAGNFYINDKSTGSIVGQQPFGGTRASGTNDKSGSAQNLLRWASARAIKENFLPISTYKYPSMQQ